MDIRRVVPHIPTEHMDQTRAFYVDFLAFRVAMDLGWVITLASPSNPTAQIILVPASATARPPANMSMTIEVADVDAMHAAALARGLTILYPLTTEPWGVRRFHVADPNGVIINIMNHIK